MENPSSAISVVLKFVLSVAFALTFGFVAEQLLNDDKVQYLKTIQAKMLSATSAFEPFELLATIDEATRAELKLEPGPPSRKDQITNWRLCKSHETADALCPEPEFVAKWRACKLRETADAPCPDLYFAPPSSPQPQQAIVFAGWARQFLPPPSTSDILQGKENEHLTLFKLPLRYTIASADVLLHVAFNGTTTRIVTVLVESLFGLLILAWMIQKDRTPIRDRTPMPLLMYLWIVPGTIVLGSGTAWAVKWLIIGGLDAFGFVTGLAGLCCGSGGLAYATWHLLVKVLEVGSQQGMEKLTTK